MKPRPIPGPLPGPVPDPVPVPIPVPCPPPAPPPVPELAAPISIDEESSGRSLLASGNVNVAVVLEDAIRLLTCAEVIWRTRCWILCATWLPSLPPPPPPGTKSIFSWGGSIQRMKKNAAKRMKIRWTTTEIESALPPTLSQAPRRLSSTM